MLDLACGTGELSVRFAKQGFKVTGVDLSTDMLAVAKAKAESQGVMIPLFEQDMAELEGLGSFEIIGIFCDSLNYLHSEEKVFNTFLKASQCLEKDGVLFFLMYILFLKLMNYLLIKPLHYAMSKSPIFGIVFLESILIALSMS